MSVFAYPCHVFVFPCYFGLSPAPSDDASCSCLLLCPCISNCLVSKYTLCFSLCLSFCFCHCVWSLGFWSFLFALNLFAQSLFNPVLFPLPVGPVVLVCPVYLYSAQVHSCLSLFCFCLGLLNFTHRYFLY